MNAREPPGAADRRRRVVAGVDRLPARRVGRGRHRLRIAERADACRRASASSPSPKKARAAGKTAKLPRGYWDWEEMHQAERGGLLSRTRPPRTCSTACAKRCRCWRKKGCRTSFRRHERHAEATRAAVRAWGLEIVCEDPREYSSSMTAIFMPEGHNADKLRGDRPRALQHVARHRPLEAGGQGRSASAIWAASTT